MKFIMAILLLAITMAPAEAKHHKHHAARAVTYAADPMCNILWPCEGVVKSPRGERVVKAMHGFGVAKPTYTAPKPIERTTGHAEVIGGRPAGCPSAFCGCGASLYLFGKIVPALNLAANWFRFPRTEPAPRMAAVRNHHVMVLVAHVQGDVWTVHDSNSGHHLTRLHERSISGYRIVNPSAGA
jgi:hypothetical protein